MAATYYVKVRCANCNTWSEMNINYGTKVSEAVCPICGCCSLIHVATQKDNQ